MLTYANLQNINLKYIRTYKQKTPRMWDFMIAIVDSNNNIEILSHHFL